MDVDKTTKGGANKPSQNAPSTGFATDALLKVQKSDLTENSNTGVSTKNARRLIVTNDNKKHWYALRTTYGREKKAYDYIIAHQGFAYYPTIFIDKLVNGRIKSVEVSRIPNIFFAYGTEEDIKKFVYDNVHLPFLRFYYRHYNKDNLLAKEPLIVPQRQMESLRIVCDAKDEDTIVTSEVTTKFKEGDAVHITAGPFAGVDGRVARYKGQQRVGVMIDEVVTAITAYIPTGMMKKIESSI